MLWMEERFEELEVWNCWMRFSLIQLETGMFRMSWEILKMLEVLYGNRREKESEHFKKEMQFLHWTGSGRSLFARVDTGVARASKLLSVRNAARNLSTRADNGWTWANILLDAVAWANPVEARANKVLDASAQANFSSLERTWCGFQFWVCRRKRSFEGIFKRRKNQNTLKNL